MRLTDLITNQQVMTLNRKRSYNEYLHHLRHFVHYDELCAAMNYGTAFSPPLSSRISPYPMIKEEIKDALTLISLEN